jgi:hypothetical protein
MRSRVTSVSVFLSAVAVLFWMRPTTAQDGPIAAAFIPRPSESSSQPSPLDTMVWATPAVNFQLMYQQLEKLNGHFNQVLYWSRLPDWKNQNLTPNPDVIYVMPFFDTKDTGPMVLEIPPAIGGMLSGSVLDGLQTPMTEVGPGGGDRGNGAKYLILPPGYPLQSVPAGYVALPSETYQGYALLRSMPQTGDADGVTKAVAYAKGLRLYPLSQAQNAPAPVFVDASDAIFDATIPYDLRFFEALDRSVQAEPWYDRDPAIIGRLRGVGIERGKPFDPDRKTKEMLTATALDAKLALAARYEGAPRFYESGYWSVPDGWESNRSIVSGPSNPAGASQLRLVATFDRDGKPLRRGRSYRLHIPAGAPAMHSWSISVYDRDTHAFILNTLWGGRSSQTPGLKTNPDGSIDILIRPSVPDEMESNWIPLPARGSFEVMARFYGPQKELFEKTWRLPDIEPLN